MSNLPMRFLRAFRRCWNSCSERNLLQSACSFKKIRERSSLPLKRSLGWKPTGIICYCIAEKKTHTLRSTLETLQKSLDPKLFVRINRGTLVRLEAIRELLPWFHGEYKVVLHDNTELRWSRRYVSQRPELLKLS